MEIPMKPLLVAAMMILMASIHPASQSIEEGRQIYNRSCTTCHGPDGAGGEMGPALGAPGRRYAQATDAQIFEAIKNGIRGTQMPSFGSRMPDADISNVTAYIRGLRGTAVDA